MILGIDMGGINTRMELADEEMRLIGRPCASFPAGALPKRRNP